MGKIFLCIGIQPVVKTSELFPQKVHFKVNSDYDKDKTPQNILLGLNQLLEEFIRFSHTDFEALRSKVAKDIQPRENDPDGNPTPDEWYIEDAKNTSIEMPITLDSSQEHPTLNFLFHRLRIYKNEYRFIIDENIEKLFEKMKELHKEKEFPHKNRFRATQAAFRAIGLNEDTWGENNKHLIIKTFHAIDINPKCSKCPENSKKIKNICCACFGKNKEKNVIKYFNTTNTKSGETQFLIKYPVELLHMK